VRQSGRCLSSPQSCTCFPVHSTYIDIDRPSAFRAAAPSSRLSPTSPPSRPLQAESSALRSGRPAGARAIRCGRPQQLQRVGQSSRPASPSQAPERLSCTACVLTAPRRVSRRGPHDVLAILVHGQNPLLGSSFPGEPECERGHSPIAALTHAAMPPRNSAHRRTAAPDRLTSVTLPATAVLRAPSACDGAGAVNPQWRRRRSTLHARGPAVGRALHIWHAALPMQPCACALGAAPGRETIAGSEPCPAPHHRDEHTLADGLTRCFTCARPCDHSCGMVTVTVIPRCSHKRHRPSDAISCLPSTLATAADFAKVSALGVDMDPCPYSSSRMGNIPKRRRTCPRPWAHIRDRLSTLRT
jgi:hypothetical protein